jgi:hypothetical protein
MRRACGCSSRWLGCLSWTAALVLSAACQKTFRGSVTQPNPLAAPNETLRSTETVVIVTGDMELSLPQANGFQENIWVNRRLPLSNKASFTVVSRDRLRFHVQIEHKWREWADLSTWDAYLIDDQGRRYRPEELNGGQPTHLVSMWDYETRTAVRDHFGDIVAIRRDGHRRRNALGSISLFRGRGDFVFYSRDIFTPDIKWMTLVLERRSLAFSFTWKFTDDDVAPGAEGHRKSARAPAWTRPQVRVIHGASH